MFNSIFWFQFHSPGASIIMGLHYYHMLDFCEMNSVFESLFRVLLFAKYFLGFLSVAKYFFGSFRDTQLR